MKIKLQCPQCDASMSVGKFSGEVNCPLCRVPMNRVTDDESEAETGNGGPSAPASARSLPPQIKTARPVSDFSGSGKLTDERAEKDPEPAEAAVPATRTITKTATPVRAPRDAVTADDAADRKEQERLHRERIIKEARRQASELAASMLDQAEKEAQEILATADRQATSRREEMVKDAGAKAEEIITAGRRKAAEEAGRIKEKILQESEQIKREIMEREEKTAAERLAQARQQADDILRQAAKEVEQNQKAAEEESSARRAELEREVKARGGEADEKARQKLREAEQKAAAIITAARAQSESGSTVAGGGKGEEKKGPEQKPAAADSPPGERNSSETSDRQPITKEQVQKQKTQMDGYARREARFIMAGITLGMFVLLYCLAVLLTVKNLDPTLRVMTYGLIAIDLGLVGWLALLIREHYKKGNEAIKAYQQRHAARREERADSDNNGDRQGAGNSAVKIKSSPPKQGRAKLASKADKSRKGKSAKAVFSAENSTWLAREQEKKRSSAGDSGKAKAGPAGQDRPAPPDRSSSDAEGKPGKDKAHGQQTEVDKQ